MVHCIKSSLENVSVKGEDRILYPAATMLILTEGYIQQSTDKVKADSFRWTFNDDFGVEEVLHTRTVWEAMGFALRKIPSTMIIDQHGIERPPFMTTNTIIVDEYYPHSEAGRGRL